MFVFSAFAQSEKPNVIFIMADDMGYECLSSNGSTSYSTPEIDKIAERGIRFTNCIAQPLCTPSRVKLMTGMYNCRNYEYFGYLNPNQISFGNLMKEAGYATCIAGKWQLNGLAYKDEILNWSDNSRPNNFGFDEYCLWQLTKETKEGKRYSDPLIEKNGKVLERDKNAYGPDIFCDFILDFIERKKDQPFLVYYPMVLVHNPFAPTPDSKEWTNEKTRNKIDTTYFKDMIAYTDKIVGKIIKKLNNLNLDENTIVIFTGDNGTHGRIISNTQTGFVKGGKGKTTDAGTNVPLVIQYPAKIKKAMVYEGLVEFSDFFPSFAEIAGVKALNTDGQSFYSLLTGKGKFNRKTAFVHYEPRWGKNPKKRFVRTTRYKLYQSGKFYDLSIDKLEKTPLEINSLTKKELKTLKLLQKKLDKAPDWE